jgi:hypothetical protein
MILHGLDCNLRWCKIKQWKLVFEDCTGQSVIDWEWSTTSIDVVREWAILAKDCAHNGPDHQSIFIYLSVCVKHNATIEFS